MLITATGKGVYFMPITLERGMIGRTVTFSHCYGQRVQDGVFVHFEFDLLGDYADPVKATNTLRRRLQDPSITITRVEQDSDYYSIPIKLFVETAINYQKGTNHD